MKRTSREYIKISENWDICVETCFRTWFLLRFQALFCSPPPFFKGPACSKSRGDMCGGGQRNRVKCEKEHATLLGLVREMGEGAPAMHPSHEWVCQTGISIERQQLKAMLPIAIFSFSPVIVSIFPRALAVGRNCMRILTFMAFTISYYSSGLQRSLEK